MVLARTTVARTKQQRKGTKTMAGRWTRQARTLYLDGAAALTLRREFREHDQTCVIAPVEADAVADFVCEALNGANYEAIVKAWKEKP